MIPNPPKVGFFDHLKKHFFVVVEISEAGKSSYKERCAFQVLLKYLEVILGANSFLIYSANLLMIGCWLATNALLLSSSCVEDILLFSRRVRRIWPALTTLLAIANFLLNRILYSMLIMSEPRSYTVRSINIGTSTQFTSFWLYTPPQWIWNLI